MAGTSVDTLTTTTVIVITPVAHGPHIDLPIVLRHDQSARSQRAVNDARDFERSHQGHGA
jgi:hypothetical protein